MSYYNTYLQVTIESNKLDTIKRREKATFTEIEMSEVWNSTIFKTIFLETLLKNDYTKGERSAWAKATPETIINHFYSGVEVLNPLADNKAKIKVDDYYTFKRVIGYTSKSDPYIYVNTKYFDGRQTILVGSNLTHEWGHKIGFSHDFRRTKYRHLSLCYLLNDIYEKSFCEIYGWEKVKTYYRSWKTLKLKRHVKYVYRKRKIV